MNKDGKQFMCDKHGLDYRIICNDCQEKNELFMQTLEEMRIDYDEPEIDPDDELVPTINEQY